MGSFPQRVSQKANVLIRLHLWKLQVKDPVRLGLPHMVPARVFRSMVDCFLSRMTLVEYRLPPRVTVPHRVCQYFGVLHLGGLRPQSVAVMMWLHSHSLPVLGRFFQSAYSLAFSSASAPKKVAMCCLAGESDSRVTIQALG